MVVRGAPTGRVGRTPVESSGGHGYIHAKDDYLRRLKRIEGQARGLQRMVEEEKYCIDILTQVSAMTKALQSAARLVRSCPDSSTRQLDPTARPDREVTMSDTRQYTVTGMTCGHCVASVT